jgi:hypothetical protein
MTDVSDEDSREVDAKLGIVSSHERRLNVHAQRIRALEDFRLLHQQTEKAMKESLEGINKHLARQDNALETIEKKLSKWGGAITVVIAIPAAIITIVEVLRLLKVN